MSSPAVHATVSGIVVVAILAYFAGFFSATVEYNKDLGCHIDNYNDAITLDDKYDHITKIITAIEDQNLSGKYGVIFSFNRNDGTLIDTHLENLRNTRATLATIIDKNPAESLERIEAQMAFSKLSENTMSIIKRTWMVSTYKWFAINEATIVGLALWWFIAAMWFIVSLTTAGD